MELLSKLLVDRWGRRKDNFDWRVHQEPLDLASVESVLILHLNDKLGDALVVSLLVDALARARADLPIAVGTTSAFVDYWARTPHIRKVETLSCSLRMGRSTLPRIHDARRTARSLRGRYGMVVSFEPYALPDHFALLKTLDASVNVGFNKHPYRLFTYSLEERRHGVAGTPVAARTARVMEVFGREVECGSLRFSVPYEPDDARVADAIVARLPSTGPRLLFNAYGAGPRKTLSPESVVRGLREMRAVGHAGPIYLSLPPGETTAYESLIDERGLREAVTTIAPMADFFKLFALVDAMDVVVSPDTSVGHVAAAFGKPQVVLFADRGTIPIAWRPYSDRCASVVSKTGGDVNAFDWDDFAGAIRRTLDAVNPVSARSERL